MSAGTADTVAGDPVAWARALGVTTGDALQVEVSRMVWAVEELWVQVRDFADQVGGLAVDGDLAERLSAAQVELSEALTILESTAQRAGQYGHLGTGGGGS